MSEAIAIKGMPIPSTLPVTPISEITAEARDVVIEGEIVGMTTRDTKSGKQLVMFGVTDLRTRPLRPGEIGSTLAVKLFRDKAIEDDYAAKMPDGTWVKVRGSVQVDKFTGELAMMAREITLGTAPQRMDEHEGLKRVELNAKTQFSAMDALTPPEELVKRAVAWGHRAVAITDHGVVQGFPAASRVKVPEGFKVIYGAELWVVDDAARIVDRPPEGLLLSDAEYVVLDIETTGFSPVGDDIIEVGAVRLKGGEIVDSFHSFVRPGKPIPEEVERLTHITNEMVADAPEPAEALRRFFDFVGDSIVVAHNAAFDYPFLRYHRQKHLGEAFENPVIDTLVLSRSVLPHLKSHSLEAVCKELKVALVDHHRADADARTAAMLLLALLERVKDVKYVADLNQLTALMNVEQMKPYHVTVLVEQQCGIKNLYKLISLSHIEYFNRTPRVPRSLLEEYRAGLLLGSGGSAGRLYEMLLQGVPAEELQALAATYDYLEIVPKANLQHLYETGQVRSLRDLEVMNERIYALGKALGKPVVAVGECHFLDPHQQLHREILKARIGFRNGEVNAPLYLRTTDEMLAEFAYLGPDAAQEVVIENPNRIADRIQPGIKVVPDKLFAPKLENSEERTRVLTYEKAHEVYGNPLPERIAARIEKELDAIIGNGYAVSYYIAHLLIKKSNELGYLVGSRGSVGSSFVAWCMNITEVNPLPPHYVCPVCHHVEWHDDGQTGSGYDLPPKECPVCEFGVMKGDGQDIPFETFMGFKGDKVPDIDLNFSGEVQGIIQKYSEELLGGPQYVFKAGTVSTIASKTAYGMVKNYLEERGYLQVPEAHVVALAAGITGVKRSTGQHPGGMVVVPVGMEVEEVTPIQYPADDRNSGVKTTHFDYHSFEQALMKLDILGHDDPTMLKMLQDLMREKYDPNFDVRNIPMNDPDVLRLFSPGGNRVLGIPDGKLQFDLGTIVLPEMGTRFVRQMLMETSPTCFSDLVRISGLSHGTDVWTGNAQELIQQGICTLQTVIPTRDDIMVRLMYWGMEPSLAFKIMESVRKGKGLTEEMEMAMREKGVPEWYIWSCQRIKYMFPKAHAAAYVLSCLRIAWFKVHYPELFYAVYFTVRGENVDSLILCQGPEAVRRHIEEIENKGKAASIKETASLTEYEVAEEAFLRGITFKPVDLYRSDAHRYLVLEDGSLLCPFSSVPGIGSAAAESLVASRQEGEFVSVEDLAQRAKLNKTAIELLRQCGALNGLPETNQLTFGF